MATLASLYPDIKARGHKVRSLERNGLLLRIKKGLYVVSPMVTRVRLSPELIASHVYAPSYVSMHSALRYSLRMTEPASPNSPTQKYVVIGWAR